MFIGNTPLFITEFVDKLNEVLAAVDSNAKLTKIQKGWLGFCLLAIMATNSVCWKRFERASLGCRSHAALSWMFRRSNIFWKFLLRAGVSVVIQKYEITEGSLVVDDSDKKRTKRTKRIYKTHKVKDIACCNFIYTSVFYATGLSYPIFTTLISVRLCPFHTL